MVHFVAIDRLEKHASLDEVFDPNLSVPATSADGYGGGLRFWARSCRPSP